MKRVTIWGIALLLVAGAQPAMAGHGPKPGMGAPGMGGPRMGAPRGGMRGVRPNWGGRHNGRWVGGWRAPGGWSAYRRPFVGFALPSYWINPTYFVSNYGSYGLSQPAYGYGWSRYYDDAVLTDRYGRVQDYVERVDWDDADEAYSDSGYQGGAYQGGREDYADSYGYRDDGYDQRGRQFRPRDRDGGVGGALIGGATGAVLGGVVAGRGDHTEGALIGGVLGAAAGAAVDSSDRYGRGDRRVRDRTSRRNRDRGRDRYIDYDYGGRGYDDVRGGSWQGGYDGGSHWGGSGPAPVVRGGPAVVHQGGPGWYGGYGGSEVTTIVIQSQPVTTTTTTVTEEVIYASAPRRRIAPRRVVHPRPRPRCTCR